MTDKKYKWYKTHGTIYDSSTDKDICIVYEHQGKETLKLVMDSLEYFPEAVELLKEGLDQLQSWKRDDEEDSFTMKRIEEFLKEINNG